MQTETKHKSSTEAELVSIDEAMGQVLWTRPFLAAQGQPLPTTTIYQDNKSTILLAKNGRTPGSKRTRHWIECYIFVNDKIDEGEIKVDFATKPLQGSIFRKMRRAILYTISARHRWRPQECVGEKWEKQSQYSADQGRRIAERAERKLIFQGTEIMNGKRKQDQNGEKITTKNNE